MEVWGTHVSAFLSDGLRQSRIHIDTEISANHKIPPIVGKGGKGRGSHLCAWTRASITCCQFSKEYKMSILRQANVSNLLKGKSFGIGKYFSHPSKIKAVVKSN